MPSLKIPPEKALLLLNERIDAIATMEAGHSPGYYDFIGWCSKTWAAIDEIYGADDPRPEEIRIIGLPACSCHSPGQTQMLLEGYRSRLLEYIGEIRAAMPDQ
jgi:hypothetical protein